MKIFGFTFGKQPQPESKQQKGMKCACCGEKMRKGDKYHVLSVAHDSCADPKLTALPEALAENLDAL